MIVYAVNINEAEPIGESILSHFPDRLARSKSFVFEDDKKRSICAGALLWSVLGIEDKDIYLIENEKPASDKTKHNFNIAHSGDYVVLAVDEMPVGVDIEKANERNMSVSKRVYTEPERAWMNNELSRFNTLWTLKESVMKITGKGLQLSPITFEVLPMLEGEAINIDGVDYYAITTFIDNYALSVCSTNRIEHIEIKRITHF